MAVLEIAVVVLVGIVIYLIFKNIQWRMKFEQRVREFLESSEEGIRKDAITRSARTLSGKALEKLVPFLERFGHDPHDVRWIGDPVDLIVFDGYSDSGRKNVPPILKRELSFDYKSTPSIFLMIQRKTGNRPLGRQGNVLFLLDRNMRQNRFEFFLEPGYFKRINGRGR